MADSDNNDFELQESILELAVINFEPLHLVHQYEILQHSSLTFSISKQGKTF